MRRSIFIVILLLIAALLLLPFFTGYLAEKKIQHMLELISETWGVQVKLDKYHRGWLHSRAVYIIDTTNQTTPTSEIDAINNPASLLPPIQIKQRLTHGPLIISDHLFEKNMIKFGTALAKLDIEALDSEDASSVLAFAQTVLGDGQLFIHFNGAMEGTFSSPAIQLFKKDQQLTLSNMKTQLRITRQLKNISKQTHISELSIKGSHIASTWSNIEIDNQYQYHDQGLWLGETALRLPFITISSDGQNKIVIKSLEATGKSQLVGNVINVTFNMALEKIIMNGVTHGPGHYRIVIDNVDAQTLSKINALSKNFSQHEHHAEKQVQLHQEIIKLLPELMGRGLQVRIQPLMLHTRQGEISAQAWLTLPDLHKQQQVTLVKLFKGADAAVNFKAPKPLIESLVQYYLMYQQQMKLAEDVTDSQALALSTSPEILKQSSEQLIKQWLNADMLIDEGVQYGFSISYKNNQLYLNGKETKGVEKP